MARYRLLPKVYKTQGAAEKLTINLKKGTYRAVVLPKYGYAGATSKAVTSSGSPRCPARPGPAVPRPGRCVRIGWSSVWDLHTISTRSPYVRHSLV